MGTKKPSRPVTKKKCPGCGERFRPDRADARYCSPACRQRAHRARSEASGLDREIEKARLHYWALVAQKARAHGVDVTKILTDECSQYVDGDGNVYMGGFPGSGCERLAGRTRPPRPGWRTWGLEAAGPPWTPPPNDQVATKEAAKARPKRPAEGKGGRE
jgi:hypothetical protein